MQGLQDPLPLTLLRAASKGGVVGMTLPIARDLARNAAPATLESAAMRITPQEAAAIRRIALEVAGPHARISLFGSRTRDDLRGGDIDLLIELPEPTADKLAVSLRTCAKLQWAIGERKIDVLVTDPQSEETTLIRAARRGGIAL